MADIITDYECGYSINFIGGDLVAKWLLEIFFKFHEIWCQKCVLHILEIV